MRKIEMIENITKLVRTEVLFAPLIIGLPLLFSFWLMLSWFLRGFSIIEFWLGMIIFVGNFVFIVSFVRSLLVFYKK